MDCFRQWIADDLPDPDSPTTMTPQRTQIISKSSTILFVNAGTGSSL